jgi:hypothetical protein
MVGSVRGSAAPEPVDIDASLANAEPPDDDDEHEHLAAAVATDAPAGARPGREPSELARPRTPRTAVVQSELGTFSVHANTAVDEHDRAGLTSKPMTMPAPTPPPPSPSASPAAPTARPPGDAGPPC